MTTGLFLRSPLMLLSGRLQLPWRFVKVKPLIRLGTRELPQRLSLRPPSLAREAFLMRPCRYRSLNCGTQIRVTSLFLRVSRGRVGGLFLRVRVTAMSLDRLGLDYDMDRCALTRPRLVRMFAYYTRYVTQSV